MNLAILLLVVLFSTSCFFFGRKKIIKITSENKIRPNALPDYYGYYLALWCAIPAVLILALWTVFEPTIIKAIIINNLSSNNLSELNPDELNLIYQQIIALYAGNFTGTITEEIRLGAENYKSFLSIAEGSKIVILISFLMFTTLYAYKKLILSLIHI